MSAVDLQVEHEEWAVRTVATGEVEVSEMGVPWTREEAEAYITEGVESGEVAEGAEVLVSRRVIFIPWSQEAP